MLITSRPFVPAEAHSTLGISLLCATLIILRRQLGSIEAHTEQAPNRSWRMDAPLTVSPLTLRTPGGGRGGVGRISGPNGAETVWGTIYANSVDLSIAERNS